MDTSDEPPQPQPQSSRSEVARILHQINAEYEAGQRALVGLTLGSARHDFITARLENMSTLCAELHTLVGNDAMRLVSQVLDNPQQIL